MTLAQKLIQNLSRNKNVQNFLSDFDKLSTELKGKSKQLNSLWNSEKTKTVKEVKTHYQKIVKNISKAQLELDREVSKAISLIIKSADDVEKNLTAYKKKATEQKNRVEKVLTAAKKAPKRKVAKKAKTSKKTARKAAR